MYFPHPYHQLRRMGSQPDALANLATIALNHGHQSETMKREDSPATSTLSASTTATDEASPMMSPTAPIGSISHSTAAPATYYRYPPHHQHPTTGHHLYHHPPHYPRGPYSYPPPTHVYHGYSYHPPNAPHPPIPMHRSGDSNGDNEAPAKNNCTPKEDDAADAYIDGSKSSVIDGSHATKEAGDMRDSSDGTLLATVPAYPPYRPRHLVRSSPPSHHYPLPPYGSRSAPPQRMHSYPGPPGYAYSHGYPPPPMLHTLIISLERLYPVHLLTISDLILQYRMIIVPRTSLLLHHTLAGVGRDMSSSIKMLFGLMIIPQRKLF